jgi:DNA-binding response OmpR family regulator
MYSSDSYSTNYNLWPDELKLLVVDDEQDVLNLIRLSLEPAGFRVLRTTKPEEGLSLAVKERPDLLLLDLTMPVMDGLELLRRVRGHPKMKQTPAIIISARATSQDQLRMLKMIDIQEDEIDAYLGKPFDPAVLLKTVKTVLLKNKDYLLEKNQPLVKPREERRLATYH